MLRWERGIVGDAWCGPEHFVRGVWATVARFPRDPGGDGQDAEVQVMALPARCARVVVQPGEDSAGDPRPGFALSTGSGLDPLRWAVETAWMAAEGMVGLDTRDEEET